ncbi:MAG: hypothetical protein WC003_06725 [Terrimicrobiaceae bacterium]
MDSHEDTKTQYQGRIKFFKDLGQLDYVALRRGEIKPRGWKFTSAFHTALMNGQPVPLTAADVYPN